METITQRIKCDICKGLYEPQEIVKVGDMCLCIPDHDQWLQNQTRKKRIKRYLVEVNIYESEVERCQE